MPKRHRGPYPAEFRRRIVELVRAGRTPESLANEFEPTAPAIRSWVRQADIDDGVNASGVTTDEREELARLRRENKVLREEREILKNSRPGPSRKRIGRHRSVPVREGAPGRSLRSHDVPAPRGLEERLLRVD